jgi:hypothetical protein
MVGAFPSFWGQNSLTRMEMALQLLVVVWIVKTPTSRALHLIILLIIDILGDILFRSTLAFVRLILATALICILVPVLVLALVDIFSGLRLAPRNKMYY